MPTADKKISALPEASSINTDDLHVIVQGGVTKKITHANVQGSYLASANNLNDVGNVATARTNLEVLSDAEVQALIDNTFGEGYIQPGTPGVPSGTTYQNSFAPHATYPLRVFITGYNQKMVVFRGMVDCSAVTFPAGTFVHVFTLPTGSRPPIQQHFLVMGAYASIGVVAVHEDGKVYLMSGMVGNLLTSGVVDFSPVIFYTQA